MKNESLLTSEVEACSPLTLPRLLQSGFISGQEGGKDQDPAMVTNFSPHVLLALLFVGLFFIFPLPEHAMENETTRVQKVCC